MQPRFDGRVAIVTGGGRAGPGPQPCPGAGRARGQGGGERCRPGRGHGHPDRGHRLAYAGADMAAGDDGGRK